MATLTKHTLSHGNSGRGVLVSGTTAAGSVPLHASATGDLDIDFDEVWLWANNNTSATVDLTVIWGLSASGDLGDTKLGNADALVYEVTPKTRFTLANGRLLQNGLSACGYVDGGTGSEIVIDGYVNRIVGTPH